MSYLDDLKLAQARYVQSYRRFAAAEALLEEYRLDLSIAELKVQAIKLHLEEQKQRIPAFRP